MTKPVDFCHVYRLRHQSNVYAKRDKTEHGLVPLFATHGLT